MKDQTQPLPMDRQIKCPNCGEAIDVQDILAHQLEDEIKQKYLWKWYKKETPPKERQTEDTISSDVIYKDIDFYYECNEKRKGYSLCRWV